MSFIMVDVLITFLICLPPFFFYNGLTSIALKFYKVNRFQSWYFSQYFHQISVILTKLQNISRNTDYHSIISIPIYFLKLFSPKYFRCVVKIPVFSLLIEIHFLHPPLPYQFHKYNLSTVDL